MKSCLLLLVALAVCTSLAKATDISVPQPDIDRISSANSVEVIGTNDLGGAEKFEIHDLKAVRQFTDLLTSGRFIPVPKSLKPKFKSASAYKVRLLANGAVVMELIIIADSVLDIPNNPMFYMESDEYSENLMAPLLRLR